MDVFLVADRGVEGELVGRLFDRHFEEEMVVSVEEGFMHYFVIAKLWRAVGDVGGAIVDFRLGVFVL
jgi:hypothetical protein